jgi:chitodextrinase
MEKGSDTSQKTRTLTKVNNKTAILIVGALFLSAASAILALGYQKDNGDPLYAGQCRLVSNRAEAGPTKVYTLNPDHTIKLNNLYKDYYNRNARCDELQFHVDHNTSIYRLELWLSETMLGWFRTIGKTHFEGQTISTSRHEWYFVQGGVLHRIYDWPTALAWGLLPADRLSIPYQLTDRFYNIVTIGNPLDFSKGQYATPIHNLWKRGMENISVLPLSMQNEIIKFKNSNTYQSAFTGRHRLTYHGAYGALLTWGWTKTKVTLAPSTTPPANETPLPDDDVVTPPPVVVDKDKDNDGYNGIIYGGNDCNDNNINIHPGKAEICGDGIDQDCSGADQLCDYDLDNDGYNGYAHGGPDCNDNNRLINPGASEICGNGTDENCDGVTEMCPVEVDSQSPTVPSNLSTTVSGGQITVNWTASTDNVAVTGYKIFRSTTNGSGHSQIGTSATNSYTDTEIVAGTTYYYFVQSYDATGNTSANSSQTQASVPVTGTNLIQNSWDFSSASWDGDALGTSPWSPKSNFTFTGSQSDPFSTSKAFRIALSTSDRGYQQRDSTPTLALNYDNITASLYVKYGNSTNIIFGVNNTTTNTEYEQVFTFNPTTGVPTWASGTNDGTNVTDAGNGWYRISMRLNLLSRGIKNHSFKARVTPAGSASSSGTYSYVTGYQLESGTSVTAYIETPSGSSDSQNPTNPTNLAASASGNQITLTWTGSTDNVGVAQYQVERLVSGSYTQIATTSATNYTNGSLLYTTSYTYRVRAQDAAGNLSGYSNTASATTEADVTPPTGSVTISGVSDNTISNGQFVTIAGSGFGTKTAVNGIVGPPVLWDDFEDGIVGELVQATAGKWDRVRSDNSTGPRYVASAIDGSIGVRTGSGLGGGTTRTLIEDDEYRYLYLDYYIRAYKGDGLKQRSNKQVMIWSANAGISEDGPNTFWWQITQGGEEPPFALSEYSCGNDPFTISYGNGWGVDEFTTARHVQIEYRQPSNVPDSLDYDGIARMWYDGQLVTDEDAFGSPSCDPDRNYLDNLFIGHYQDIDSAIQPINMWISCPGHERCNECPVGSSGCSVYNPDWLPARQDEFFYDRIYIDKSIARVELGNASTYSASNIREVQIPSSWGSTIQITINQGLFTSGQTAYVYVTDNNGNVNSTGFPVTIN